MGATKSNISKETGGNLDSIKTSVQLIDDAVYTDGSGTVSKGIAVFGQDGTNPQAIKTDSTGRQEVVDGGQSLTVDAPVGTPVFVRISNGSSAIDTLPVADDALSTLTGGVTETAPGTDTASSGLNGRLQRIAQRITSLIALLPTALGSLARNSSLSVTQSTEDLANTTTLLASLSTISGLTQIKQKYGTSTSLAVTALHSLANSATVGWKSVMVDNTSTLADDYEIFVKLDMANTSPANDKAVYVYLNVWFKEGSNWYSSDGGTATLPTDSDASYTIASPNNLKLLGVLSYTTADMIMQGMFTIGEAYSKHMPHGWSLVIVNYSGAAIAASGSIVWYAPLFKQKIA